MKHLFLRSAENWEIAVTLLSALKNGLEIVEVDFLSKLLEFFFLDHFVLRQFLERFKGWSHFFFCVDFQDTQISDFSRTLSDWKFLLLFLINHFNWNTNKSRWYLIRKKLFTLYGRLQNKLHIYFFRHVSKLYNAVSVCFSEKFIVTKYHYDLLFRHVFEIMKVHSFYSFMKRSRQSKFLVYNAFLGPGWYAKVDIT